MEIGEEHQKHVRELQKLSYTFYASLAKGDEPLTYTAGVQGLDIEFQVEVIAEIQSADSRDSKIKVFIGFDTNFKGRFGKAGDATYNFWLGKDDSWQAA